MQTKEATPNGAGLPSIVKCASYPQINRDKHKKRRRSPAGVATTTASSRVRFPPENPRQHSHITRSDADTGVSATAATSAEMTWDQFYIGGCYTE